MLAEYHKANPPPCGHEGSGPAAEGPPGAELKEADAILTAMLRGGTVTAIADPLRPAGLPGGAHQAPDGPAAKLLDSYRKSGREVPFVDDIYASFPHQRGRTTAKKVLENLVSCGESW